MSELTSENMGETKNKPTVNCGCGSHAILRCGETMVDVQDADITKDFGNLDHGKRDALSCSNSEGREMFATSVVGCNANNGNAGRTLNANNAVANGNDNYAGGFATNCKEHLTSWPSRSNTTIDNHVSDNAVHGQSDYGASVNVGCYAEMNVNNVEEDIWHKLHLKNTARNLKGLRKFYLNKEIVVFSVKRACKDKATHQKIYYFEHAGEVADRIIDDIKNNRYEFGEFLDVDLPQKYKTSKKRHAKIFPLYDRCVQNLVLTIIEEKLRNKVVRNNYSNIKGRGILCNNKKYCMINKVRHAVMSYNDSHYLLTDVQKFYESTGCNVVLKILSKTIKDGTTMTILKKTLEASGDLPIGCSLSPLIADVVMGDYDRIILSAFKPKFFAAFGDNRLYIGNKNLMYRIRDFTRSYYKNHYHFKMKADYQIGKVSDGLRFCKTLYNDSYARIRGEIKRRAVRASRDEASLASYCGMFNKSDSKYLVYLLKHHNNKLRYKNVNYDDDKKKFIMRAKNFEGIRIKLKEFIGKTVCLVNYRKIENNKDSEFYVLMQMIAKDENGYPKTYVTSSGHHWVKEAYLVWEKEMTACPIYLSVKSERNGLYFDEYHMTNIQITDELVNKFSIDLSKM